MQSQPAQTELSSLGSAGTFFARLCAFKLGKFHLSKSKQGHAEQLSKKRKTLLATTYPSPISQAVPAAEAAPTSARRPWRSRHQRGRCPAAPRGRLPASGRAASWRAAPPSCGRTASGIPVNEKLISYFKIIVLSWVSITSCSCCAAMPSVCAAG